MHLEVDPVFAPPDFKLLKVEVPDEMLAAEGGTAAVELLADLAATRAIGDQWLAVRAAALLRVPSVLIPETFNWLLNPVHPDAARLHVVGHGSYPWDLRLRARPAR